MKLKTIVLLSWFALSSTLLVAQKSTDIQKDINLTQAQLQIAYDKLKGLTEFNQFIQLQQQLNQQAQQLQEVQKRESEEAKKKSKEPEIKK